MPTLSPIGLEEIAAQGWQALESRWLGRWLLRASEGFTGRGNSVLPLGSPGLPLDEALGAVQSWYADRGLVARFQLPLPGTDALDDELDRRGWSAYNRTIVLTAPLGQVLAARETADGPEVGVLPEPSAQWLAAYHYRGASLPPVAVRLLTSAPWQRFALIGDGWAIGRVAVADGWAGVTAMEVAPAFRRRGLGGRVLWALCREAQAAGAHSAYLQMAEDNEPARRLYAGWSFTEHHRYVYRQAP